MTHDELLHTISADYVHNKAIQALYAVVELHKPWTNLDGKVVCAECCNYGADRQPPCPTIQAIEEQLK